MPLAYMQALPRAASARAYGLLHASERIDWCNTMNPMLRSDAVLKHHGGVDVLVNAAGFSAWQDENIIQGGCSCPCTRLYDANQSQCRETRARMLHCSNAQKSSEYGLSLC